MPPRRRAAAWKKWGQRFNMIERCHSVGQPEKQTIVTPKARCLSMGVIVGNNGAPGLIWLHRDQPVGARQVFTTGLKAILSEGKRTQLIPLGLPQKLGIDAWLDGRTKVQFVTTKAEGRLTSIIGISNDPKFSRGRRDTKTPDEAKRALQRKEVVPRHESTAKPFGLIFNTSLQDLFIPGARSKRPHNSNCIHSPTLQDNTGADKWGILRTAARHMVWEPSCGKTEDEVAHQIDIRLAKQQDYCCNEFEVAAMGNLVG